jgi:hypothetical protein
MGSHHCTQCHLFVSALQLTHQGCKNPSPSSHKSQRLAATAKDKSTVEPMVYRVYTYTIGWNKIEHQNRIVVRKIVIKPVKVAGTLQEPICKVKRLGPYEAGIETSTHLEQHVNQP